MTEDLPGAMVPCERCGTHIAADALFCPMCGAPRASRDGDPLVGEVIADRYLLRRRIGHGGSGTIYLAEHVTLRRRVAVKILHHELSRDDLAMERFRREATTVGEIDNDHIVEVFDFGRAPDGRLFLVMEFLEGETLAAALARQGRLPIPQVVDILVQLGEALVEAHGLGYVHRDLRPRNVFLIRRRGRPNFVKLLDFGLAKLVEKEGEARATSLGMTFGDPCYMSPEQAHGDPIDRRADIYSLGVIAHEMLVGQPPFQGGRVFDILSKHLEEPARPPSTLRADVPAWLDAIITRALAKSPGDRFITVYRFVEALRQGQASGEIMSDAAAQSYPAVPPPPPAPRGRPSGLGPRVEAEAVAASRVSEGLPEASQSSAWFADGEALAGPEAEPAAVRPAPARAEWPSADLDGLDDDEVYEPRRDRRKLLLWGAGVGGVLVALVIALVVWPRGGGTPLPAASTAPADAAALPAELPAAEPPDAQPVAAVPPDAAARPHSRPHGERPPVDRPPPPVVAGPPDASAGLRRDTSSDDARAQAEFFVKLGQEAMRQGDVVGAASNFNKAREFDHRNSEAIAGLGEVALRQGYFDDAAVHLEAASRLAPRSTRVHTLRGQAYLGAGKPKQAAAAFRAALKIDPDNDAARRGYEEAAAAGGE